MVSIVIIIFNNKIIIIILMIFNGLGTKLEEMRYYLVRKGRFLN